MTLRFSRVAAPWCAAALTMILPSCTVLEPGAPPAAVTVRARSVFQAEEALEQVFREEGFRTSGRTMDTITFEKEAGKTDRVLYGNWIEGQVAERVRVTIFDRGDNHYRLRCLPSVVRDPYDVSFEDDHRRMELYSFHYTHLLREVKRMLAEVQT